MNLYTEMPTHVGEKRFATKINSLLDERAHAWFGINYLPGVRDIDLFLWHEDIGVFTIEVKSVPLSAIESFSLTRCTISGREEGPSPHIQAKNAELTFRNYLLGRRVKFFNVPTAAFPDISRSEWNLVWATSERLVGEWAETIIFQEDLQSGPDVLLGKLLHIYQNPPSGSGSDRPFPNDKQILERLKTAISPDQERPKPIPSDMQRLRELEESVYRETKNRFQAFGNSQLVYSGHPGTGKTFRLLQIGYEHASEGARVLFICFNKVLAADIRRLLIGREYQNLQMRLGVDNDDEFVLDVIDVWDALTRRLAEHGLEEEIRIDLESTSDSSAFDARGREAVEILSSVRDEIALYDTVLIDETQDFREWQFDLAKLHLRERGTLLIAHGKGQELYPVDPAIEASLGEFQVQQLRRNFRNTKESFRAAYVAHQSQLDRNKIKQSAKRFVNDFSGRDQGLDFERPEGRYPILEPIDMGSLFDVDRSSRFYAEEEMEALVTGYKQILKEQLEFLDEKHRPIDLLLLVPTEKCTEARAVRSALGEMGVEFVDLTDEKMRRVTVASTSVRICTFHSSRGIEGYRVVVFGISSLPQLCKKIGLSKPENLLYVVLTRAVFETTIAVRSDEWNSDIVLFIQEVVAHLSNKNHTQG